jgi:chemotaxis protein MotA
MFVIFGLLVVIGAVVGGYLLEHGHVVLLLQPAELMIIGGAALGTVLIANPLPTILRMVKGVAAAFTSSRYTTTLYLDSLKMLNAVFSHARKNGIVKLEEDIEDPHKSQIFSKYPAFLKDHHTVQFVCDTLRMAVMGGVEPFQLDQMMELDMEVHHQESSAPVSALTSVADSLPGLGIVAAVLGVVITMGSLGGPPEEIGEKVAAALVGTFLGILMCYGFFGPLASNMAKANQAQAHYYNCLRVGIISYVKGAAPLLAVEFARRTIPHQLRPTFKEMEEACKAATGATPAAAA